jgi:uncharacterized RDD family membrane protein YckC
MKPRFEPDGETGADDGLSPTLIDPEAFDASEQTFAASLEATASRRTPKFVIEEEASEATVPGISENQSQLVSEAPADSATDADAMSLADVAAPDPEAWRREVAARLSHYRARRRPREPRYPSLQLKFETEPVWNDSGGEAAEPDAGALPAKVSELRPLPWTPAESRPSSPAPRIRLAEPADYPRAVLATANEATAKVIDFASYSAAVRPADELAEPVLDRPRIIEAPELVPPPPALGGISIEAAEEPANERRPGFEIPLQAAPMGRRVAAASIDAGLVMAALAAFAYIFFRITAEVPSPARVAGTACLLAGSFWCAYQYFLLVYSGATPGLNLARLELQRFDGNPVPRGLRRWRVLASVLSGVSLGLGYAWCMLDEDQLCWHDRITRTYMAPKK